MQALPRTYARLRTSPSAPHGTEATHEDEELRRGRALAAVSAEVVEDRLRYRPPTGLWPSDHAGVVGGLFLRK